MIRVQKALEKLEGDEAVGASIVHHAVESPLRQLVENAGEEGAIVQEVKKSKQANGYNVATGEYIDLIAAGIIDPTKVTRSALQHADQFLDYFNNECMITDIPEKEAPALLVQIWAVWAV